MTDSVYGFAIHTSSPDLGLALSDFSGHIRTQRWNLGRELSGYLHQYLVEFLQPQSWSELAFIAVANGPGGFTGTRVGVVAARTLAQQLQIPLFAVSSLGAIAWQSLSETQGVTPNDSFPTLEKLPEMPMEIAVQMPAQRGHCYGAIYAIASQSSPTQLVVQHPDQVFVQAEWQDVLAQWPRPYQLIEASGGLGNTATGVLALAYQSWHNGDRPDWSTAIPFYGQSPV